MYTVVMLKRQFPHWEVRFCRNGICRRRAWLRRPSFPWGLGGCTRKSLGSMVYRDRNRCSDAVPKLFAVSCVTVEFRYREENCLVMTHRSCTSLKHSAHRAMGLWVVGWALKSRIPAWSPFVEAAIAFESIETYLQRIRLMKWWSIVEIWNPKEGKRVMGSDSYTPWIAYSPAPLSITFQIGWMAADG